MDVCSLWQLTPKTLACPVSHDLIVLELSFLLYLVACDPIPVSWVTVFGFRPASQGKHFTSMYIPTHVMYGLTERSTGRDV